MQQPDNLSLVSTFRPQKPRYWLVYSNFRHNDVIENRILKE